MESEEEGEEEEEEEKDEDKGGDEKEDEKGEEGGDSREEGRGRSKEHSGRNMKGTRRRRSNTAEYLLNSGNGSEYVTLILQLTHATGQCILLYYYLLSFYVLLSFHYHYRLISLIFSF